MQVEASGTKTADGTEQTLTTVSTDNKVLQLMVDLGNMANGDITEIREKSKALVGSTARERLWIFANAQVDKEFYSEPIGSPQDTVYTLKQTAGVNRNYDWSANSF